MQFVTDTGRRIPSVTSNQMREIDRIAIDETGPNLFQMMENAGRNLATIVIEQLVRASRPSVLVMAGTGGNGGGGITAARHLANRGIDVAVMVTNHARLQGVPGAQHALFETAGGETVNRVPDAVPGVVVDAVIGYSLRGAPNGVGGDMVASVNEMHTRGAVVVSLDVPSGLDATTGVPPGDSVVADVTMTLALPKPGLVGPGIGALLLADIGIPLDVYRRAGAVVEGPVFDHRYIMPISPQDGSV